LSFEPWQPGRLHPGYPSGYTRQLSRVGYACLEFAREFAEP